MPYAQQQASSTRLVGFLLVALLHAIVIYGLVMALKHRSVFIVHAPIETKIIDEVKQERPPPPPPPPELAPPPPAFVPPPEIRIETPPPPKSAPITVVTPEKPVAPAPPVAAPAPAPVAESVKVLPKIDARNSREPPYPPASRRLGEQGSLILQVLVGSDGRVRESKLVQSSGFARLDAAALDGVKGHYRFMPGTVDGKPSEMWYTFKFTWKLN